MKELILRGKENISHIYIQQALLQNAGEILGKDNRADKVCIVTDSNVQPLYLTMLCEVLNKYYPKVISHIIPAGEENKNLHSIEQIYHTLAEHGFGRNDMVVALGGGVVGDMAGFAAATYMRGIRHLVQIPTTLLAQVDSSVGGKCGVDLSQGKNLVGAFRQPDVVMIDPETLRTLPKSVYCAGMAEVIKYGCIKDVQILEAVDQEMDLAQMEEIITTCVEIKRQVVEEDETESGPRKVLNFGHTVAHGIEKLGNYVELSHGEAVAIGMVAALQMGEACGITKAGSAERVKRILTRYQLLTMMDYPLEPLFAAMMSDKKKQGDHISFIFIEQLGNAVIQELKTQQLKEMLKEIGGDCNG